MNEKKPNFEDEAKKIRDDIKIKEEWEEASKNRKKYHSEKTSENEIEKLALREKLNLALVKLQEIIGKLPKEGRDYMRALHTLQSVEGAISLLGKSGAPKGKYAVSVEGYPGNPQEPYVQNEGIPVDELVDILRNVAREMNRDIPTKEALAEMKKKVKELDELYKMAIEETDKAAKYNQWEKARKEYRRAEELCDLGPSQQARDLKTIADELFKNSQGYFEAHYTKEHGEGESVWTQEEKNKQDLRTRLEAKLVSLDYRATGTEEGDYSAGMDILKNRRELKLEEDEKKVDPLPPKDGIIVDPEIPVEPKPKVEVKDAKLLAVDVSDIAEQLARQRATERLNEILKNSNFFKRMWYRTSEEAHRLRLYEEELAKIKGVEGNIFGDPKKKAEHDRELQAEFQRFQEELFRTSSGETKEALDDPAFSKTITDLMREYATTKMSDEDFLAKKKELLQAINKKYPDSFGPGRLSVDNFLAAAVEFRKLAEHGQALAQLDSGLKLDLGVAKRVVKTDANLRWIDKMIADLQKRPVLSKVLVPGLVVGFSAATFFVKKPAYALGGAVFAGSLFGGLRRAKDLKVDVATHRMERAMGRDITEYGEDKDVKKRKNREKMEQFVYATRTASDIKDILSNLIYDVKSGKTEALTQLIENIADAEARMSLAETESVDLIQYEGERVMSQSRLELLRNIAEAKTQIPDQDALEKAIAERKLTLAGEVKGVNSEFTKFRVKESLKAAVVGGVIGGSIGAVVQEGLDKIGIHAPDGKQPALERLYHYFRGESVGNEVPTDFSHVYAPLHGNISSVSVPQGTSLVEGTSGLYSLVDNNTHKVLSTNIAFGQDGNILSAHDIPGSGISLESHMIHSQPHDVHEYLQANKPSYADELQEIHRHGHLMNDTEKPDLNELQLKYAGVNGTGYDKNGDIVIDLHGLKQFNSFQGGKHPDITQLLHEGKIKFLITPDLGDQHHGILVDVDASGKVHIPAGSAEYVHTIFGKDANGRLTHPGIFEAVIADEDGKFTPIATDPDGGRFVPSAVDGYRHIFHRTVEPDWNVPPFIPIYARRPLEDYKGTGDAKNFGRKIAPPIGEGPRDFDLPESDISIIDFIKGGKKLKIETSIASRGQTISGERDLGAEYPNEHIFLSPRQIAEKVLFTHSPILGEDAEAINGEPTSSVIAYLEKRIQEDKTKYENEEAKKRYAEIISRAYNAVDATMSKYGGESRSDMPSLDKIHLVGFYEYQSQTNRASDGICFLDSGEIFINMYAIEKMNPTGIEDALTLTLSHEITHDSVTNNYWGFETEEGDEKVHNLRRSGLLFVQHLGVDNLGMPILKERGRLLNEAVTEELAQEAGASLGINKKLSNLYYLPERKVLKAIQDKFNINFQVFAEAVVNRRKLPALVRAMAKSDKRADSGYVSMLLAIMDYESRRPHCRETYPQTMAFIQGKKVNVDENIYEHLGDKFLDENGFIKDEVAEKYNIQTWGRGREQIAA